EAYEESLRKMKMKVYMMGQLVENPVDDPIIRPSMNSVKMTYELAQRPEHEDLMTAKSSLTGQRINRFCHLHQSTEDLIRKVKMQRLLGQRTAACFQRCVGMDAINAVDSTTYEMDRKLGTEYHKRFRSFLLKMQEEDWTVDGAMTDVKGDRNLPPHQQADPDLFVRVVEKNDKGIIVRGAKAHQTGAINSHWVLAMPTIAMGKNDSDYAVAFVAPADADGIFYIYGRQSCDTRKLEGGTIDVGNAVYGGHEALMVFDNLFVPWENVLMCGEYEFSGMLVERFAGYHRQSYACKVGVGDVLIGASQTIAEYNGAAKASHIKDKIIEMNQLNETLYCGCIACASEGHREPSGTYCVDPLLANVHKQNVTRFPYEIARLAQDIAGGLMVTLPSEADFRSPDVGKWIEKYCRGVEGVPVEDRMRVLRLIENLTLGSAAVGYLTESMHGAGSPQAQRIMISRLVDLKGKQRKARRLCGITTDSGSGEP
ncbi:MAG: 4-hydroxybutyryl-CoA dehydratase, partial [Deltaproteobacteria bacterium HGW-Deltaproteobacteria-21]